MEEMKKPEKMPESELNKICALFRDHDDYIYVKALANWVRTQDEYIASLQSQKDNAKP